jgi:agmatine deiminase
MSEARAEYRQMLEALARHERVRLAVPDRATGERVLADLSSDARPNVEPFECETDDSWARDIGPTFAFAGRELVALDWRFNSWGGKYAPWDRDDAFAARVAELSGARHVRHDVVLEGGTLEVDGRGTLLITRSSGLDHKRNPELDRTAMEALLETSLGVSNVVWLDGAIGGDDTDAHIDNLARFTPAGPVVCARRSERAHVDFTALDRLRSELAAARDADGRPFELVDLPLPAPREVAGELMPESYANFYVANDCVLVPVFDSPTDEPALRVLEPLFPGRALVPIRSRALVRGLGSVHCLTQQQPAPAADTHPDAHPDADVE